MKTKRRIVIVRNKVSYGAGEIAEQELQKVVPVVRCLWCFTPREKPRDPSIPISKTPCHRCRHYGTTTRTELETRGVGIEEYPDEDDTIEDLSW